jgi:hypothetical protein
VHGVHRLIVAILLLLLLPLPLTPRVRRTLWPDLTCRCTDRTLDFRDNSFGVAMLNSLTVLTTVRSVQLANNPLLGTLPSNFGSISPSTLQDLGLDSCQLSGTIPSSISRFTALRFVHNTNCDMKWSLELECGCNAVGVDVSLMLLRALGMSTNLLSGSVPSELGLCTNLRYLNLRTNSFTGSIPPQLTVLQHLQYLLMSSNFLAGGIPNGLSSMGSLVYVCVRTVSLPEYSVLTAFLAWCVGCRELDFSTNVMAGTIPASISHLQSLRYMHPFCPVNYSFVTTHGHRDDASSMGYLYD